MSKAQAYRAQLNALKDWDTFLLQESGLPGPRGNIELGQAVADEGNLEIFQHLLTFTAEEAPVNTPEEFLAFCGILGLGRLLAEGHMEHLPTLRACANDPRWRAREAVAMALQRLGDADMDRLLAEMREWAQGSPLEQRAAAAGLCEPRLLKDPRHARAVLDILDQITASILANPSRRSEDFLALRKGLAYCWSVAAAALPEEGKARMEKWLGEPDPDVRWIMKENLKKNRLSQVAPDWVKNWIEHKRHTTTE
ncbi:MAG: HEAT repeat domain-containing protein [Anaerolineaceae bacterium]|nr:HEAT repeat domain-containing protein [Anaerolineaceae bacterium]